jgi:hypothetical protein
VQSLFSTVTPEPTSAVLPLPGSHNSVRDFSAYRFKRDVVALSISLIALRLIAVGVLARVAFWRVAWHHHSFFGGERLDLTGMAEANNLRMASVRQNQKGGARRRVVAMPRRFESRVTFVTIAYQSNLTQ